MFDGLVLRFTSSVRISASANTGGMVPPTGPLMRLLSVMLAQAGDETIESLNLRALGENMLLNMSNGVLRFM